MSAMSELDIEMGMTPRELRVLLESLREDHAQLKRELDNTTEARDAALEEVEKLSNRREHAELLGPDVTHAELDQLREFVDGLETRNPLWSPLLSLWDEARKGSYLALVGDVTA